MTIIGYEILHRALTAAKIPIPDHIRSIRIVESAPDDPLTFEYTCFLTPQELLRFSDSLSDILKKEIANGA